MRTPVCVQSACSTGLCLQTSIHASDRDGSIERAIVALRGQLQQEECILQQPDSQTGAAEAKAETEAAEHHILDGDKTAQLACMMQDQTEE